MQPKNGAKEETLAPSHVLLKVGNDWCIEHRDNDLKPDWLKMFRSNNE